MASFYMTVLTRPASLRLAAGEWVLTNSRVKIHFAVWYHSQSWTKINMILSKGRYHYHMTVYQMTFFHMTVSTRPRQVLDWPQVKMTSRSCLRMGRSWRHHLWGMGICIRYWSSTWNTWVMLSQCSRHWWQGKPEACTTMFTKTWRTFFPIQV